MSKRQTAIEILQTQGYLSKNILARTLKISLLESGEILESILPFPDSTPFYTTLSENCIKLHTTKFPSSKIYAISKTSTIQDCFKIEHESRDKFYSNIVVYPPADSGIYLQAQRETKLIPRPVQASTVKPLPIKPDQAKREALKPSQPVVSDKKKIPKQTGLFFTKSKAETAKIEEKGKDKAEEIDMLENTCKNESSYIEEISENLPNLSIKDEFNEKTEAKSVKFAEKRNNDEIIETPATNNIKKIRKDTPYPHKASKTAANFKDLTANRNIYDSEEEEEAPKPQEVIPEVEPESLKSKSKKRVLEKKVNPGPSMIPSQPIITKRKVLKTRTIIERDKLITEDYTSEEEVVINPTPIPIGKKQGHQTLLSFKTKIG